jgi:hypothetical protein
MRRFSGPPSTALRLGMLFLALGLAWPRFLLPGWTAAHLGAGWIDGLRGLLLGLGIGLNLLSLRLAARGGCSPGTREA